MLGRSGGPLLAFYGSRGLGKTSLLRAAQRGAAAAGYLTVWVTGRDDVALAPDLAASLTEEISRRSTSQKAKGILQNLSKVQVEVGVPGAKVGVEADRTRASAAVERNLAEPVDSHASTTTTDSRCSSTSSRRPSWPIGGPS